VRLLGLGTLLLATAVVVACGGDDSISVEEALRRMVLQPADLPEGFLQGEGWFSTNEELASTAADPEVTRTRLEEWGRILGYEVAYEPEDGASVESPVRGISASANLYQTEEGAREAFADAVKTAEDTDWVAKYAGLRAFQQEGSDAGGTAEDIVWLRLSGFQPLADESEELVTDDLIFFREGRERGFLRVLTVSGETEDRGHYQSTVEGWLRTLVRNVQVVLRDFEEEE
jgi:hypothetical protein